VAREVKGCRGRLRVATRMGFGCYDNPPSYVQGKAGSRESMRLAHYGDAVNCSGAISRPRGWRQR
jgi:hypothetical protein